MPSQNDIQNIWLLAKESLRGAFSTTAFGLWFNELQLISLSDTKAVFLCDTDMKQGILQNRHAGTIAEHLKGVIGFDVEVEILSSEQSEEEMSIGHENGEEKPGEDIIPPFEYNFEYTFDNFIVGNSNKFAHAACTAVANNPAFAYNPLFIYGPSGLGKTHLMYAITNKIAEKTPSAKIVYIKGEDFTNELIEAISNQKMNAFRDKYRKCDVLLIDDIQFIAGKVSTQEEFFHTFNALYEEHKQIILTSDRTPREINTLEDRLKTRFEWGLIADIQPPDMELRVAIIKKKAEAISVELPADVLEFLAENLQDNIRQIEGALKKIGALSFLSGMPISMELARGAVAELLGGAEPVNVTVDKIFSKVTEKYGVSREELVGSKRNKEIANARHTCIYMVRNSTDMSLPNIGKLFNRDHTTVLSSVELIEKRRGEDPIFNAEISEMMKALKKR